MPTKNKRNSVRTPTPPIREFSVHMQFHCESERIAVLYGYMTLDDAIEIAEKLAGIQDIKSIWVERTWRARKGDRWQHAKWAVKA